MKPVTSGSTLAQVEATLLVALALASRADAVARFGDERARRWRWRIAISAAVLAMGVEVSLVGINSGVTNETWKYVFGTIPLGTGLAPLVFWAFWSEENR